MNPLNPVVTTTSLTLLPSDLLQEEANQQKFLRFCLGSQDSGLLPLEQISEVLSIDIADILPVPEMPDCVLGVYNWRGKMLWLIDLGHLVDYLPLLQHRQELEPVMAIVVQLDNQYMGLVVQQIKDIELHDTEQLQKAAVGLFPPKLLPFVKGYLPGTNNTVLDIEAIARFPMWQVHRS